MSRSGRRYTAAGAFAPAREGAALAATAVVASVGVAAAVVSTPRPVGGNPRSESYKAPPQRTIPSVNNLFVTTSCLGPAWALPKPCVSFA